MSAAAARSTTTDPAAVERNLRLRLLGNPADAEAAVALAMLLDARGEFEQGAAHWERAIASSPDPDAVRLAWAQTSLAQGRPHAALDTIGFIPEPTRSSFDVATVEAAALGVLGRHEPEIVLYERLLASNPKHAGLWTTYGNALKYAGRGDDASRALRRAVQIRPGYGEGWWAIANLKSERFTDRDIKAMRQALSRGPTLDDAMHLRFALGRAYEERRMYADSFEHYDAGNRLRAGSLTPQAKSVAATVDEMVATFDSVLLSRVGRAGHESAEPIFVVGLQRSGSTLVEQILASHPDIEGTSELPVMQQLWRETAEAAAARKISMRDHLAALTDGELAEIGQRYLDRSRPFRNEGKAKFVDKLPANWLHTGFIRLVLPNARILDTRRHPMACGFSNFQQHYARGVFFAYSQESIAAFYRNYLRLMRHFASIDPNATHLVINEHLIERTEEEVRRMLAYVGVPFAAECLTFHRTRRAVNTPSAEQVRRPINRDGMEHWRNYEPWLDPLRKNLGPALSDWETNQITGNGG